MLSEERWHELWGADAVGMRLGGSWWWVAYKELQLLVAAFRGGLASLGVGPGDAVAIVSANRLEWIVACYATYGRGASVVAIDAARPVEEWRHVLADSRARVAIGEGEAVTRTLLQARVPTVSHVVGLEPGVATLTYETLLDRGRRRPVAPLARRATEVAHLVYRLPGGVRVALTDGAIDAEAESTRARFALGVGDRVVIAAPWSARAAHIQLHAMLTAGCAIALPDAATPFPTSIAEAEPTMVFGTPPLLDRLRQLVDTELSRRPRVLQPFLRRGMRAVARRRDGGSLRAPERLLVGVVERMMPDSVRMPFGSQLRYVVCSETHEG